MTSMGRSLARVSTQSAPEFARPVQFVHLKTGRRYQAYERQNQFWIAEFFLDAERRPVYSDRRPVSYTIGSGNHARSFLVARGGRLYQAPVTYYTQIPGWDMSPGYDTGTHLGFTRRVTADCLFCHSGRVNAANRAGDVFDGAHPFAEVAISCERCHGPGRQHLLHPGKFIVNPASLSPILREQVCEQCHLFGAARVLRQRRVAADFRPGEPLEKYVAVYNYDVSGSQALAVTGHSEQMKRSRCWQGSSERLWCGSCHQIHTTALPSQRGKFYREKCLACHQTRGCSRRPDPENSASRGNDCIACHMPKRPVVESAHVTFTDHQIARYPGAIAAGEPKTARLKPLLPAVPDEVASARDLGFAELQVASASGRTEFFRLAIQTLEPLRQTGAVDAEYWQDLGSAYLEFRQMDKAETAFRNAIALDSRSAASYYSLGFLYQSQRLNEQAILAYRHAVDLDPEMPEAWGNLASAYLALGQQNQAVKSLAAALRLNPGNLDWRRAVDEIQRQAGSTQ